MALGGIAFYLFVAALGAGGVSLALIAMFGLTDSRQGAVAAGTGAAVAMFAATLLVRFNPAGADKWIGIWWLGIACFAVVLGIRRLVTRWRDRSSDRGKTAAVVPAILAASAIGAAMLVPLEGSAGRVAADVLGVPPMPRVVLAAPDSLAGRMKDPSSARRAEEIVIASYLGELPGATDTLAAAYGTESAAVSD